MLLASSEGRVWVRSHVSGKPEVVTFYKCDLFILFSVPALSSPAYPRLSLLAGPNRNLIMVCWYQTRVIGPTCHYLKYGAKEWTTTTIPASLMTHMTDPETKWGNQCGLVTNGQYLLMGGEERNL